LKNVSIVTKHRNALDLNMREREREKERERG